MLRYAPNIFGPDRAPKEWTDSNDAAESLVAWDQNLQLMDLLESCHATLEDLRIGRDGLAPMHFPASSVLPLPALRRLDLVRIRFHTENLAKWIAELKSLKVLNVKHCRRVSNSNMWRSFFRAIRRHTNKLEVDFDEIRVEGDGVAEFDVHYLDLSTAESEKHFQESPGGGRDFNGPYELLQSSVQISLAAYLLRKGGWDGVLEGAFSGG